MKCVSDQNWDLLVPLKQSLFKPVRMLLIESQNERSIDIFSDSVI